MVSAVNRPGNSPWTYTDGLPLASAQILDPLARSNGLPHRLAAICLLDMVTQISGSGQVRWLAVLIPTVTRYVAQTFLCLRDGAPVLIVQLERECLEVLRDVPPRIGAQSRPHDDGLHARDTKDPPRRHRGDGDAMFPRHGPKRGQDALEGSPAASGPDEAEILLQGPVEGVNVLGLRLPEPLLGDEAAEQCPVAEEPDATGHAELAHPPPDGAEVYHGAGDLVGGDVEAGVEQHLEVGGIGVGQAQVCDFALGLEAGQVCEVVDVRVVRVVPDVVCWAAV